jgi:hypothetical protein
MAPDARGERRLGPSRALPRSHLAIIHHNDHLARAPGCGHALRKGARRIGPVMRARLLKTYKTIEIHTRQACRYERHKTESTSTADIGDMQANA